MTIRKADNVLRGDRTPAFVSRETGAAELQISADSWDAWVKDGRLPPPSPGFPASKPRWRWKDVDSKLSGRKAEAETDDTDAFMRGVAHYAKATGRRRNRRPSS